MKTPYAKTNLIQFGLAVVGAIILVALRGAAQTQPAGVTVAELVHETVTHELAAANVGGHYMYRSRNETPHGSETYDMVETRNWLIGRLILKDDRPLPPAQRQQEDQRLRELLGNRTLLVEHQNEQLRNHARVRRMIKALPEAFVYEPAGAASHGAARKLTRVTFRPNPAFTPRSGELRVLQAMEGSMLIDLEAKRLVRLDAKLVQDVDFGWGILAHIYRDGTFLLEQRGVGDSRWAITTLELHYTNRILLLIKSRVDSVRKASEFRRMPDDLTLEQGLELLLRQGPMTITTQETADGVR